MGLAVILAFIGVKLILEALHTNELHWVNGGEPVKWAPVIPIWLSLAVIVGVLLVTTVLSLVVAPRRTRATVPRRRSRRRARRRPRPTENGRRVTSPGRATALSDGRSAPSVVSLP